METAEMIEEHIDYIDEEGRSVHLPTPFVKHYMQRHDGALPIAVAISTLPIVLADGALLAPDGLDRQRGIVFMVPRELLALIPRRRVSNRDIKKAMQFLTDEWLCDVATDYRGKCTLVAAALSLIERSLLPDRPVFFVSAGRRGSGKTTALSMLLMAVTGLRPAAAAWSPDEEERRKALMSYFLYGVSYILWDNISRGALISCPHIEKSCTSAYYSDRKLGVSEMVATAASAIHFFTGNNIGPRGDLASRSLHVRLQVDRPDPENRSFEHSDPIGWTDGHRAEILAALYTVLLGNPMLKKQRDAACKTRFKVWWRLVGSALEHGAGLAGHEIDFQDLFLEQDEDDEDAASLADCLAILQARWPNGFKAADVAGLANDRFSESGSAVFDLLFGQVPANFEATPKAVGKRLKNHLDEPVWHGERTLTLKAYPSRDGVMSYYVKVS
jgi:hypothetical protein